MTPSPATAAPPSIDALVSAFDRDGVAVVESLLPAQKVAEAKAAVEWALAQPGGAYKWIPQRTYAWFRERPIFLELIEHPLVIGFARAWLGEDFHLIAAQCSRNTREDPYAPGAMGIHRDEVFYPRPEREMAGVAPDRYSFSAMWYVQDTPLEMGPTQFMPGSHKDGRRYIDAELDESRVWSRPLPVGSLILFNHRTAHRGRPNQTDRPRDLITNAYARPEVDKVQLTQRRADGSEAYVPPVELLETGSAVVRQLLRPR